MSDSPGALSFPWSKYKVDAPNTAEHWTETRPLESVYHIAHVDTAIRIVEDSTIRARLVSDESILNTRRIEVVWLSPNDWHHGSRYGNVQFTYSWKHVVAGKKAYWIEVMPYGTPALRILITDSDYDSTLQRYDPYEPTGPWWYDKSTDTHYWNGNYCLELMIEENLNLGSCSSVDFVSHHPGMCCVSPNDPGACPEIGLHQADGAALFLGALVDRSLPVGPLRWVSSTGTAATTQLQIASAYAVLRISKSGLAYGGGLVASSPSAIATARSLLGAFGRRDQAQLAQLAALYATQDEMVASIRRAVSQWAGLPSPGALDVA